MKKFLLKLVVFLSIISFLVLAIVFFVPDSYSLKESLLFSVLDKNRLLEETESPRVIFVGGSNLNFGLDSQQIKDSLGINPINTASHAGLGLIYMLKNTARYIKENDIVVVVPEYDHFFENTMYGGIELNYALTDITPSILTSLDIKHILIQLRYIPQNSSAKVHNYFFEDEASNQSTLSIYGRRCFNQYGDIHAHWNLEGIKVSPREISGEYNPVMIKYLKAFQSEVEEKGGHLLINFPCFQDSSFDISSSKIKFVENKLSENGFSLLASPARYRMKNELFFDTEYHLTKTGVDIRTKMMIEDLKTALHSIFWK